MKGIIILAFTRFIAFAQAQTPLIAHKSHSGSSADFFIDPSANFGIPSRKLLQVVYVNDSTTVRVYTRFGDEFEYDTIRTATNYSLNIDSVKQHAPYLKKVEYVNFKHSSDTIKVKQSRREVQPQFEIQDQDQPEQQLQEPKKKKKSYLLFLFGITGGGMLLMRLFRQPKAVQPIA